MRFVRRRNLPGVAVPEVYAYEGPGSQLAAEAGAIYMLLEGLCGNTLQDVAFDICSLPVQTQEHIIAQWTRVQTELATLSSPQIGSVSAVSDAGEPVVGRLVSAAAEGLADQGPFASGLAYFEALAQAGLDNQSSTPGARLGALVFADIVRTTGLFRDDGGGGAASVPEEGEARFPLNHMDLGTQNILVDDSFNFLAVIDWEFAQTAPWQVNHFPMPFPLHQSDAWLREALENSEHIAHKNVSRQERARRTYVRNFREAEASLHQQGRRLAGGGSFADVLDGAASRIYACYGWLGTMAEEQDAELAREMVRLAFGLDAEATQRYLDGLQVAPMDANYSS